MFTPGTLAGVGAVVLVNTFVVAVAIRFLRLQLDTLVGVGALGLLSLPILLFATTAILTGAFGLGGDIGGRNAAVFLTILTPSVLGIAIDLFWRRPPEQSGLPDRGDEP
jgi:hypothetical protein